MMTRTRGAVRLFMLAGALLAPQLSVAQTYLNPPALPAPSGRIVNVSTEAQLQTAVKTLTSGTTIVIAPGTYKLTATLYVKGTLSNIVIRGASNSRNDVVLVGLGMNAASGSVPFGIWTGGNISGVTIANLTIRDVHEHAIIINPATVGARIHNVRLLDIGDQFVKGNPDANGIGPASGIVEYSVMEYTTEAPDTYTNGVDIHGGHDWIVRGNLFRNITNAAGLAGPAVLMWNRSANTITEANTFLNCERGIAYGLIDRATGFEHQGGIIRNNMIYRSATQPGDVGIIVSDAPNVQILNNTVFLSGTYATPIEYRFATTTGTMLINNLLSGSIGARNGATGTARNNLTNATSSLFVNAAAGDLHLAASATSAIDRGLAVVDVAKDIDGQNRPAGPAFDIGADERGASASAPGTPGTF
jgi:hypothetical protein